MGELCRGAFQRDVFGTYRNLSMSVDTCRIGLLLSGSIPELEAPATSAQRGPAWLRAPPNLSP